MISTNIDGHKGNIQKQTIFGGGDSREVIEGISSSVSGLLDIDSQVQLANKQENIHNALQELENEILRLRKKAGYNYFLISYVKKLSKGIKYAEWFIENDLFMKGKKLPKIVKSLLSHFPSNIKSLIKQKLYDDYLIDLAFELMNDEIDSNLPTGHVEHWTFSSPYFGGVSFKNSTPELVDFYLVSLSKYAEVLNDNDFRIFFNSFINAFCINMSNSNLEKLEYEQIETIFSGIRNIPYKIIQSNSFNKLENNSLIALFKNLGYSKFIGFSGNQFFNLPDSTIIEIIPYLKNVKRIKFSNDRFDSDRQKLIRELLPNTEIYYD